MLNKAEQISAVAAEAGVTKADAERVLDAFVSLIINQVAEGQELRVSGFASFKPVQRAARTTRNPQTGDPIDVPAKTAVKISPLTRFKNAVSEKK